MARTPSRSAFEARPGPSEGAVVLDIGEGAGALVVYAPAALEDAEVEIRARGGRWTGRHVAVRRRAVAGGERFAAVFPALRAGPYELRPHRSGGDAVLVAS